ncbi:protoporphyrinogen oxidase [Camelliibacillus cellulosilyticus]|uniref:Coproporphyrinogen III oxidase n=1 Tax=Camelliibacillus cellulosilyticus TaxID=2174486 RepID=A0ABV9GLS8_9BACL
MNRRIVIVGGGITGLSSAFYVQKLASEKGLPVQVTLLEASDALGGKVQSVKRDGFVIERGPDSFLKRKPEMLELVEWLGMGSQTIANQTGKSYILKDDELHPIPEGSVMGVPSRLGPLLETGLLSMDGKARALNDLFIPKLPDFEDMSVGDFFDRRLGSEVVDHIISPLLSGIYAGDIYKLSLETTLPQFIDIQKRVGSLILGLSGTAPKKKTSQFATVTGGLNSIIETLVESLEQSGVKIQKNTRAQAIEKQEDHYELGLADGRVVEADAIILAVPHRITEQLLPTADGLHRNNADPDTSVATISLAFDKDDVKMEKEGTGFVVSRREPKAITAATWTHMKWGHAAPEGKALIRCYVGKAGDDRIIERTDNELVETVLENLGSTVTISGDPLFTVVSRWPNAMPQYPVGHKKWLAHVTEQLARDMPNIYLAGASYDGVGLPDCVRQAKTVAYKLLES